MIIFIVEKRTFDVKPGKDKTLEMNKQGSYLLEDVLHHRRFSFRVREPLRNVSHSELSQPPELVSEDIPKEEATVKDVPDLISSQALPSQQLATSVESSASPSQPPDNAISSSNTVSPISTVSPNLVPLNPTSKPSFTSTQQQMYSKRKGKKKHGKEAHIEPIENLESFSVDDIVAFIEGDK